MTLATARKSDTTLETGGRSMPRPRMIVVAGPEGSGRRGTSRSRPWVSVGAAVYPSVDSGVTLQSTWSVVATTTGTWSVGGVYGTFDADGTTNSTKFESCSLVPTMPMGTLVGTLDGANWFRVGVGPTTIAGPGTLRLAANECPGPNGNYYGDNSGNVIVTLRVVCP